MDKLCVVLVAMYRNRNFPIRIMHPLLEKIENVNPHTIFFKDNAGNMFEPPTAKEEELFVEIITDLKPDLVGFSVLTPYVPIATRLTSMIRECSPSTKVIWGGTHPTLSPESVIDYADLVCVGEGEGAMTELVASLRDHTPYDSIQNLWVKKDGDIIKNPMRPMVMDLDALPYPSYANDSYYFLDDDSVTRQEPLLAEREVWVQASRGCPYSCTFCVVPLEHELYKGLGPPVRRRSVTSIIDEIHEYLRLAGPTADYVFFLDEVFGVNKEWLDEFEVRYKQEVGLPFFVEYHPKSLNSERLRKLVNAGMDRVDFGIQTGSDELRDKLFDRKGTNKEIIALAHEIADYGVRVNTDLIVDNPYETEETLKETVDLILQLPKPLYFNLFQLKWFPEYILTKQALEEGVILPQESSVEHLMQSVGEDWAFVPKWFPYEKKQMLQNIIWLIARNLTNNRIVRFAVFGDSKVSAICLAYLNAKSVVLGKLLGTGGFVERHSWIAKIWVAGRYILRGDFKTLRRRLSQHIYTFRQRGSHSASYK